MAALDQSLDDIIKSKSEGGRERKPIGRAPGAVRGRGRGRQPAARTQPYARPARKPASKEMEGTTLKVSESTVPNKLAGAICNVVREAGSGLMPSVLATGPGAINQAIKGIAIARKYLLEESPPIDIVVQPVFEKDMRSGSNVSLVLSKSIPIDCEPTEDDLSAKDRTDCFKLAGAIAGRIRDGGDVALTTKGPVPVLVAVKAIALAQEYTSQENMDVKFAVQFRDLEDPELGNTPSTYLHFAVLVNHD